MLLWSTLGVVQPASVRRDSHVFAAANMQLPNGKGGAFCGVVSDVIEQRGHTPALSCELRYELFPFWSPDVSCRGWLYRRLPTPCRRATRSRFRSPTCKFHFASRKSITRELTAAGASRVGKCPTSAMTCLVYPPLKNWSLSLVVSGNVTASAPP